MKKIIITVLLLLAIIRSNSQTGPISWNFSVNKLTNKTYEVHIKATVEEGWHVFSTVQPVDALPMPTTIKFGRSPMIMLSGKIKEIGIMKKVKEPALNTSSNQYERSVDFIQLVKKKGGVKTHITGSVNFQACTNEKCLPPKTVSFNLPLE
ncbi:MAG: hypothetical protein ABI581_17320 [Sediminibacterium sp.]